MSKSLGQEGEAPRIKHMMYVFAEDEEVPVVVDSRYF